MSKRRKCVKYKTDEDIDVEALVNNSEFYDLSSDDDKKWKVA